MFLEYKTTKSPKQNKNINEQEFCEMKLSSSGTSVYQFLWDFTKIRKKPWEQNIPETAFEKVAQKVDLAWAFSIQFQRLFLAFVRKRYFFGVQVDIFFGLKEKAKKLQSKLLLCSLAEIAMALGFFTLGHLFIFLHLP